MTLDLPRLIFAFVAGASALLSPCGFPMLPGYISYYMGTKVSLGKAVPSGAACTLGLVTVFSMIGTIAATLGSLINPYLPLLELVAGLVTIVLGFSMLFEVNVLSFSLPMKAPKRRGLIGIFLYGVLYGLATLGCSAPIFFSILFWAISGGGVLNGIITFIIYALGMGLPLTLTTILLAMAKELTIKKMVKMLPWIKKISGIILVAVGIYLIYLYHTAH